MGSEQASQEPGVRSGELAFAADIGGTPLSAATRRLFIAAD